ncbi:MAG: signal peptidase I [Kiritimatiellae bacterium]|nr:signal peptidase I [Kiritimatiellia bacterium]
MSLTKKGRLRKERKTVLGAARVFMLSYGDLPDVSASPDFALLQSAYKDKDVSKCKELLELLDAPKPCAAGREWLDILVVSISVAMAFRAYFYEPFNIPTGSMQPTLYGNHSLKADPAKLSMWDTTFLKWGKWLFTGKMYECFRAPFDGYLLFQPTNTGHYDMRVRGAYGLSESMLIPTDVLHGQGGDAPSAIAEPHLPNGLKMGMPVRAGQVLWQGYVVTGDFLFVNRWLWNFRHPQRGDVMIFSTTGIKNLQQGTHYIKRMTGLPNEKFTIKGGKLIVDGKMPMAPRRIAQIQNREKYAPFAYPYAGYLPSGAPNYFIDGKTIVNEGDVVTLGKDEYYACGDNSPSSYDSRFWGSVPAANLRGIAGGVFWPIVNDRWGLIE